MARPKINDSVTAKIEDIDEKGRGMFHAGSAAGLALGLIPGEEAVGTVTARREGKLRIRVEKMLKKDASRGEAPCAHFGACGGCLWQDIAYERQCELKRGLANKALSGILEIRQEDFVPALNQFRHRNRMDFVFGRDGELGLKAPERWDKFVNLDSCLLMSEEASEILRRVRKIAAESGAPFWNNYEQRGFWRYLVIREGKNAGERLALITTSREISALPRREEFAEALKPLCSSLLWGINPEVTDLSIPKTIETVFGAPYLHEKANGLIFRIPPASFFQTNTQMAEKLQAIATEFAAPAKTEKILDLYCGSGFLSLALARSAGSVLGLEIDEAAVALAKTNAELNSISNAEFRAGAAEKILEAEMAAFRPDAIVVDPPRAGLHPAAARSLAASGAKRIVYVSCNPFTLARDLRALEKNYRIGKARCLDLFPHTPHVETVVALEARP